MSQRLASRWFSISSRARAQKPLATRPMPKKDSELSFSEEAKDLTRLPFAKPGSTTIKQVDTNLVQKKDELRADYELLKNYCELLDLQRQHIDEAISYIRTANFDMNNPKEKELLVNLQRKLPSLKQQHSKVSKIIWNVRNEFVSDLASRTGIPEQSKRSPSSQLD